MDRIRKLKAERAKLLSAAKEVAALAAKEERPLTDDERTAINENKTAIGTIDAEIKTLEELVELERTAPAPTVVDMTPEPAAPGPAPSVTVHERSLDDPNRGFRAYSEGGMAEYLNTVIEAGRQGRNDPIVWGRRDTRLVPLQAAAGSDEQHGDSQRYGGFTVPQGFTAQLLMLDMENDPTAGVTTLPMAVPSVQVPARVDKNHSSSVAGGITVGWRPQTVSISSSRMDLEQIDLRANTLAGVAYVAEELLNDSALTWAGLLQAAFSDAVTDAIIQARFSGTGAGEPMGVLNSPCLISVSTTGQTTGTLTAANITGMRQRVWRYDRAVWIANHDTYSVLVGVAIAHASSDTPFFQPARGLDAPDMLLGRPIIFTEYAQSLNTVGDIMCCVWSEYLVGNLQGLQQAESVHVRFLNNERAFRFTIRQAGHPWWRSALTPVNSSETLSPFVALATRTT